MAARALLVAAVVAAVAGVAWGNAACDPSYECVYRYTQPDLSAQYTFDFTSLCSNNDYVLNDQAEHTYHANICGYAETKCFPATWKNTYITGVAVQFWGATPACTTQSCSDNQGNPECCTADCQVLGVGAPQWSLLNPSNPKTGGVKAKFTGAAASDSDPFWCTFDPSTGAQYPREVHFNFYCDEKVSGVAAVTAHQNSSNDCRYELDFKTAHACAGGGGSGGMSGGWVFIIILVVCVSVYIIGGMGYGYFRTRRLEFPNLPFWNAFANLVRDGFLFVGHGFKKQGGSMAGAGAYDDIGASATAGGATASYTAAPSATKSDEPYTDL